MVGRTRAPRSPASTRRRNRLKAVAMPSPPPSADPPGSSMRPAGSAPTASAEPKEQPDAPRRSARHDPHRRLHDAVTHRRDRQRTLLGGPGLGMNTRRPATADTAVPQLRTSSSRSRSIPYPQPLPSDGSSQRRRGCGAHPPTPCQHALRQTLSNSAWNRLSGRPWPPGTARLQGSSLSFPTGQGGPSRNGTHPTPPAATHKRSSALPSPQVVLSCGSTGTTAASDALPAAARFPVLTGYGTTRSAPAAGASAGEGLPSPAATL